MGDSPWEEVPVLGYVPISGTALSQGSQVRAALCGRDSGLPGAMAGPQEAGLGGKLLELALLPLRWALVALAGSGLPVAAVMAQPVLGWPSGPEGAEGARRPSACLALAASERQQGAHGAGAEGGGLRGLFSGLGSLSGPKLP